MMPAATRLRRSNALSWALPFLLLAGVVLLVYYKHAFSNLILARGDVYLYFYPYWRFSAEALQAGRLPLWNPDLFMGAPFLANSQAGWFYPPNWPLWLLLATPYAVSAAIILHVLIAGCGTYWAARRALAATRWAAFVAALLFALGGFITAQAEHVNQVQGMAWTPWMVGVVAGALVPARSWRRVALAGLALAGLFALQLLAGHTQTTFISGVGLLIWLTAQAIDGAVYGPREARTTAWLTTVARGGLLLGGAALLALLLSAVQLLPTLELTRLSLRQSGLTTNEALSFSLHPLLLARAILPGYGQTSYVEYVAYVPLTGLVLALAGTWRWRSRPGVLAPLALALFGVFLALGEANPLYSLGLVHLPGFDLFRVPARWLALTALGTALLAAVGWDEMAARGWRLDGRARRPVVAGLLLSAGLVVLALLVVPLARFAPLPPESPAEWPNAWSLLGWAVEAGLVAVLLLWGRFGRNATPYLLLALMIASLFAASRVLSSYDMTAPEAYFDVRPAAARIQADAVDARAAGQPPGRYLSKSQGFFDPGDQGELDSIYGDQLSQPAQTRLTITVKQREIVVPNLALLLGLSAVDGFDGGVLPSADYAAVADLLLPPDVDTVDGRLRESIRDVPDARWLDLFNVRYLLTDKVGDQWARSGDVEVFFDLQHRATLAPGASVMIGDVPPFEATELWLLAEGEPGLVTITVDGLPQTQAPQPLEDALYRVPLDAPGALDAIELSQPDDAAGAWTVAGVALVDTRDGAFQAVVPGNYRLIHSGDVKVYENLDVLPRAFMVGEVVSAETVQDAVDQMRDPAFDPRQTAVLLGHDTAIFPQPEQMTARVVSYAPEQVVIEASSPAGGVLLLTDAHYPGWRATIDGVDTPIYQADGLFRAVVLPLGQHEVIFTLPYDATGLVVSGLALLGLLLGVVLLWRRSTAA